MKPLSEQIYEAKKNKIIPKRQSVICQRVWETNRVAIVPSSKSDFVFFFLQFS